MKMERISASRTVGVEYYANMGPVSKFLPHRKRDEMVYLVWDRELGTQLLSLGLGQPLNSNAGNADRWVVKATLSLDMD